MSKTDSQGINVDITLEVQKFKEHLELPDNNQIVFSGLFGTGKTFFLKKFFEKFEYENEESDNEAKYIKLWISPVNYSIAQTDDIIQYIKYDIAFQLLSNGNVEYDKVEFSKWQTSEIYFRENAKEVALTILKNVEKLGIPFLGVNLSETIQNIEDLYKKIKKQNDSLTIDEEKSLIDFLKNVKSNDKSIYEEKEVTLLISSLIQTLKIDGKKIVLVIDDLDRLDPEHIFRILNVFSCHFDFGSVEQNKFNVDKVITVCDIENIRNIYHSKYGQNVDFSGYIDKFYSREIYYFDNKRMVSNAISQIVESIKFSNNEIKKDTFEYKLLKEILNEFVNKNLINLRSLLKFYDKPISVRNFDFSLGDSRYQSTDFSIITIFEVLISFCGSPINLQKVFQEWLKKPTKVVFNHSNATKYGYIIHFLISSGNKINNNKNYDDEKLNLKIEFDEWHKSVLKISTWEDKETNIFPLTELLIEAYWRYLKLI